MGPGVFNRALMNLGMNGEVEGDPADKKVVRLSSDEVMTMMTVEQKTAARSVITRARMCVNNNERSHNEEVKEQVSSTVINSKHYCPVEDFGVPRNS
jgi:hypothetical protein